MFLSRDLFFSYWFVSAAPATLTMQALCNSKRWIRPGVKLGPTTIGADPGGIGAFAPIPHVPVGSFLGVYRAGLWTETQSLYRGTNSYVMQAGLWRIMPRIRSNGNDTPNLAQFPILAVQEPPVGTRANCIFMTFHSAGEIGAPYPKSKRVECVALYSARDLAPGEELFVHYGDAKHRHYDVGEPPEKELFKYKINPAELPGRWLLGDALDDGYRLSS